MLDTTINQGEDFKTEAGVFMARQVISPNFEGKRYGRKFDLVGGREYTIYDLINKGNRYPVFTFRNSGMVRYRNVMWRMYFRLRLQWRHKLYQNFYDNRLEYKTQKVRDIEKIKRKKVQMIWRNNLKIKFKK